MLQKKRQKLDKDYISDITRRQSRRLLEKELYKTQKEVEPILAKRQKAGKMDKKTYYKLTYRAVLAKQGYLLRRTLDEGNFSKVKLGISLKRSISLVAIKIVDRTECHEDFVANFLPREVGIWPKLSHPNIIKVLGVIDDKRKICMILEYAENGNALQYIKKSGALGENLSKVWMWQICYAIQYLHGLDIAHRDLKLANLLLDKHYRIKLCDFGFVKGECDVAMSRTYCCSPAHGAPEILKCQPYDPKKVDIWAIGVILFTFLTGRMPFDDSRGVAGVLEGQKNVASLWLDNDVCVPRGGRRLVLKLLTEDFHRRPDVASVMRSRWLSTGSS